MDYEVSAGLYKSSNESGQKNAAQTNTVQTDTDPNTAQPDAVERKTNKTVSTDSVNASI